MALRRTGTRKRRPAALVAEYLLILLAIAAVYLPVGLLARPVSPARNGAPAAPGKKALGSDAELPAVYQAALAAPVDRSRLGA